MENFDLIEAKKQEIDQLIMETKSRAITFQNAQEIFAQKKKLEESDIDHSVEISLLEDKLKNSTITVQTLPEFVMLMEKIADTKDEVIETISHENAHANIAEEVGATHEGYSLLLARDGDDFKYITWTNMTYPCDWLTSDKITDIMRIYNAPEEYGNKLSGADIAKIKKLKSK